MGKGRNSALDGVRGWAAVAVIVFHSVSAMDHRMLTAPPDTLYGWWARTVLIVFNGNTAVCLFFILSGCVLMMSLRRDEGTKSIPWTAVSFFVKRVLRIYPAVIASVAGLALTFWLLSFWGPSHLFQPFSASAILANLSLYDWQVHGATWTLNVEMYAVPFLLMTGLASRCIGDTAAYLFAVVAVALHFGPAGYPGFLQNFNLIYFAVGTLVPTQLGRMAVSFTSVYFALFLMLFCRTLFDHDLLLDIWVLQAFAGFLFIAHLFYAQKADWVVSFLSQPVSQFLGKISYSLYLWNVPIFLVLARLFQHYITPVSSYPIETGLLLATVITLMTVPVAALSERFIERPFINLGRAMDGASRPVPLTGLQDPSKSSVMKVAPRP